MKLLITRELRDGTPRKAMTPKRRKHLLGLNDNRCQHEGCTVTSRLELDHDIPLALGGSEDDGNIVALCGEHHAEKTRADIHRIAKAKRQRKLIEEVEPTPFNWPVRQMQSRGFPKDLRKTLAGRVVRVGPLEAEDGRSNSPGMNSEKRKSQ